MKKPDIYIFNDYRNFLQAFVEYKKQEKASYSLQVLSNQCGDLSRPLLSLILSGERNLNEQKIHSLSKAIGLNKREAYRFENLVRFNQAKNIELKEKYFHSLKKCNPSLKTNLTSKEHQILEKWYTVAILELSRFESFKLEPNWIQKQLKYHVSTQQINISLNLLLELNILKISKNGKIVRKNEVFKSTDEIPSQTVKTYHLNAINLAKKSLLSDSIENREFTSVMLSLDEEKFSELKKQIKDFCSDLVISNKPVIRKRQQVVQLNMQLIKITGDSK